MSGWADGYSNTVFRLLGNLEVPRRGLIGPWSHLYPHLGQPGPAIDFLTECRLWWDRWLKGEKNGIENEPDLRVWMQESVPPTARYDHRPGRWVAEASWPSRRINERQYATPASSVRLNILLATRLAAAETGQAHVRPGGWAATTGTPALIRGRY